MRAPARSCGRVVSSVHECVAERPPVGVFGVGKLTFEGLDAFLGGNLFCHGAHVPAVGFRVLAVALCKEFVWIHGCSLSRKLRTDDADGGAPVAEDGRDRAAIDEPAYLPFGEAKLGGDLADGEQFRRTCGDRRGHSSV